MNQYIRSVWWIASILYLGKATAEDNQICSCLPHEECSRVIGVKLPINEKAVDLISPCKDPGTEYCCRGSSLDKQKVLDMAKVVEQELNKERQLVKMMDDLIGNMGNNVLNSKENENSRQEKSISDSTKNVLQFDNKQYETKPDKLIIVYAENNTKHNDLQVEKNPLQIVLPSEQQNDTLMDVDNGENTPQIYKIEQSVKKSTEKLPPTRHVHKSIAGISKLHRLFPKRRVIPSKPKSEESTQNRENDWNDDDDLEESASEVDEISTQPLSRSPPRHLVRQQVKNESPRQKSKNVHDLFKSRSKNVTSLPEIQQNLNKMTVKENITTANIPVDVVAENINVRVINDLMKTNYTGQYASRLHGSNTLTNDNLRYQLPTNTVAAETRYQSLGQKVVSGAELTLNENRQHSTAGTTQLTEERNNTVVRKRLHMKRPGVRTHQAVLPETNQEQISENTSLKPSPKDYLRKSLSSRRSGVIPQSQGIRLAAESTTPPSIQNSGYSHDRKTTQMTQRINIKSTAPTSVFGDRIARFRQRSNHVETTSAAINKKNIEEPTRGTSSVAVPVSEFKPSEVRSEQTTFPLQPESGEASREPSIMKTQDLESSGTDDHPSRVLNQNDFLPPTEMATGFQPIINIQDLKTVGPLPGGFLEQSKSFNENPDGFGISLPVDAQPRSMGSQSFEDFDYNSMLLPPVFLPPQHTTATELTPTSNDEFDTASLLPPVQLPMPLAMEMFSERETLTKIQEEFNVLKSQYDLLLSRYANTLRQYNDEYDKIIQSSKTNTES